jgi:hypothetical protein
MRLEGVVTPTEAPGGLDELREAAQRLVASLAAHYRCPACDKNGQGHTSACPALALANALAATAPGGREERDG